MPLLGISEDSLLASNAVWTAREILQQPEMIKATQDILVSTQKQLERFLQPVLRQEKLRIIFTGAGTSAFVGECLAPMLSQVVELRCEAISTTDLVSAPTYYLDAQTPTLMVSFARSGNSPESVAAIKISNQIVKNIHHLIITCNDSGELMQLARSEQHAYAILLPEKTHDKSFAMTSSFTSMLYAALSAFTGPGKMNGCAKKIEAAAKFVLDEYSPVLQNLAKFGFERVVFLGSHAFKGIAQESALKLLELTDGETVAAHDSPMGFRHGPKTIVKDRTLVVVFVSNDPYTRQYDLDLLNELHSDGIAHVVAISAQPIEGLSADDNIIIDDMENAHDHELLVPFMVSAQLFAFYQSLHLGHTPDNPDTSGRVNRVVQGVIIHAVN